MGTPWRIVGEDWNALGETGDNGGTLGSAEGGWKRLEGRGVLYWERLGIPGGTPEGTGTYWGILVRGPL